jgi:hypothetical protein
MTTTNNMVVAETILAQLGGNRFLVMTGAKNLLGGERELSMKLGRNEAGVTHMRVELRADDTYDVHLLRVRGTKVRTLVTGEGIYADGLREFFTTHTGMYTSL